MGDYYRRTNYSGNSASDQARQHNGDAYTYSGGSHYHYYGSKGDRGTGNRGNAGGGGDRDEDGAKSSSLPPLPAGVDIYKVDRQQRTALHRAAEKGATNLVKLLIQHGAELDDRDGQDQTPLARATYNKKVPVMKVLLDAGAFKDPTLLLNVLIAAYQPQERYEEVIATLLATGYDANEACRELPGTRFPVRLGMLNLNILKMLFEAGLDITKVAVNPLSSANNADCVDLMLKQGASCWIKAPESSLYSWVNLFSPRQARILIAAGANVNQVNYEGKTPLYIAAEAGREDLVEELLKHGANVNATGPEKLLYSTPLMIAAHAQSPSVVRRLIAAGADVHAQNAGKNNWSALNSAGNDEIKSILTSAGARNYFS